MAKMSTFPLRANVIHMLSNCDLRRGCCGLCGDRLCL